MLECESCHRHFRMADARCPFCTARPSTTMLMSLLGGALTTVVLAACYGGVPTDKVTPSTGSTADTGDTSHPETTP